MIRQCRVRESGLTEFASVRHDRRMSAHDDELQTRSESGVATLELNFAGRQPNRFDSARANRLRFAIEAISRDRSIHTLVLTSSKPAGFCAGYQPAALASLGSRADAWEFALVGQALWQALHRFGGITIAKLHGPCWGPGWELAAACDYRFSTATPDGTIGASAELPPCFGQLADDRFDLQKPITYRQAFAYGLVDDVCSARRSNVEWERFLGRCVDRQRTPRRAAKDLFAVRKRWASVVSSDAFQSAVMRCNSDEVHDETWLDWPTTITIVGDSAQCERIAIECAIHGCMVNTNPLKPDAFAEVVRGGRVTPLEAEQARKRIAPSSTISAVLLTETADGWQTNSTAIATLLRERGFDVFVSDSKFHHGNIRNFAA